MNRMAAVLVGIALLCMGNLAHGEAFTAKVIAVLDGDTVLIWHAGHRLKIRLAEIDAPEKAQPFGAASKRSLSGMVMGKQVRLVSQTMDRYGRMVAHLGIGRLDVDAEQVRRGMAWEYSNFHSNRVLTVLQREARQARRGLWIQNNPTPPWIWRKQHPNAFFMRPVAASPMSAQAGATSHAGNCGSKRYCSEMSSCEEARHYFVQCGVKTLDGNGDGVPCEKLCGR